MQASLAVVGLLSSIAAWLAGASVLWVVGGVLLGSVIPFTLIVILPTNKRLLSLALDRRAAETERLLARWGMLHAVRSVLNAVAQPLLHHGEVVTKVPRQCRMCDRSILLCRRAMSCFFRYIA